MNSGSRKICTLLVGLLLAVPRTRAADPATAEQSGDVWAAIEENDRFAFKNLDRHYTQGLKFIWLSAEDRLPQTVDRLLNIVPAVGLDPQANRLGATIGQNIYTPKNLTLSHPDPTDRPYAGWFYAGLVLQRQGTSFGDVPILENLELDLGIVGPQSLADSAQANFHRLSGGTKPIAWAQQLQTEPGLLLRYGRFCRLTPCPAATNWFDLVPYGGGVLGNVEIAGTLGVNARLGWNLPPDFGPQTIDGLGTLSGGVDPNSAPWLFYVFGGTEGRAVAHNLFLDGNSFQHSPSVDREPWVADLRFGLTTRLWHHFEFGYIHTLRTREFRGQRGNDQFGSLVAKAEWNW